MGVDVGAVTVWLTTVTVGVSVTAALLGHDLVAEGSAVGRVTDVLTAAVGFSALGVSVA